MHTGARHVGSGRRATEPEKPAVGILVVCTANQCRSPVAASMLGHELAVAGIGASVASAGLFGGGLPVPEEVAALARARGLDLSAHRSHPAEPEDVRRADLVLGMTREHVREMVMVATEAWPRTFTLPEVVRRARRVGPRQRAQSFADWRDEVHHGRRHSDLLGSDALDDITDPMGGPVEAYERMFDELAALTDELVALAWPRLLREPPENAPTAS